MGIQTVVQEGVKIMDMFADTESEQYQAFKSMLTLWNPESSKWAVQASKGYKKALNVRASRYVISYTGKSLSEAFILTSTNPQYDKRLFFDLPVQYIKTTRSEHGENMVCTQIVFCFCFDIQNNFCTQHVLPMF